MLLSSPRTMCQRLTLYITFGADGGSLVVSAGLLTGTLAIGGFQAAGYGSNHQDLSPKYSGILFGLSNASASSAGAIAVFITGRMHGNISQGACPFTE